MLILMGRGLLKLPTTFSKVQYWDYVTTPLIFRLHSLGLAVLPSVKACVIVAWG